MFAVVLSHQVSEWFIKVTRDNWNRFGHLEVGCCGNKTLKRGIGFGTGLQSEAERTLRELSVKSSRVSRKVSAEV